MSNWNDPTTLGALIVAVTGLLGAATAMVTALRAHGKVKNEVRPQIAANKEAIAEVQTEIAEVKNGTTHP